MPSVKEMARVLIERLPDTATFDDLMYALYVRQKIEAGLKDAADGRVLSHEEVVRELLPTPALNSPDAAATHNDRTRY